MKNNVNAIIFGIAIVLASALLGYAIINRNKESGTISVTGLGETNFSSDLVVWEGRFTKYNYDLKMAYSNLEKDKSVITKYLTKKGIDANAIVFSSVNTIQNTRRIYSESGDYMGEEFNGYTLSQGIEISSNELDKVEKISREITELLNQGVQFYSEPPRYYYTKLADLKIEMVSKATENARIRAEQIATNSNSKLNVLKEAKMGIFQITGQHSDEDYSWGGAYNTTSREKTASITMKLTYSVD